jgi:hypothetical protein
VHGVDTGTVQATGTLTATAAQTIDIVGPGRVSITNAGTIQNTAAGGRAIDSDIEPINRAVILNNSGLIQSEGGAVRIQSVGDAIGFISSPSIQIGNTGTIKSTVGGIGIDVDDQGHLIAVQLSNNGLIQATDGSGVRASGNTNIQNLGTIQSQIGAGGYGAYDGVTGVAGTFVGNLPGGTIIGVRNGVSSSGALNVQNNYAGGPALSTITGQNGAGIQTDGTLELINNGNITGAVSHLARNGDGDGVNAKLTVIISNAGRIQGTGSLDNTSEGISAGGGLVSNGGTIIGANNGILISDGAGGSAVAATSLSNNGTITGNAGYGVRFIGAFNDTFSNSGTISGTVAAVDLGDGDDTLNLGAGSSITGLMNGGAGSDTINLSGTGALANTTNFETLNVANQAS